MAIDAKMNLIDQTRQRLGSMITVDAMEKVITVLSDVIEGYDFRIKESWTGEEKDDLLECFLDAMSVQGRSLKTIARYRYVITKMMEEVKIPTRQITVYHLRKYINGMKDRSLQESTMEGNRQIFSSYFNWLQRESLIDKNPTANLGAIKCAKKQKKTFSDLDIENMRRNVKNVRDRAILEVLRSTGCRVSEVVGLNIESLNLNGLQCIVHGKGNKERIAYIDQVTAMFIRKYLETRNDMNPALFINRYGQRFKDDGIREMLDKLAERAQVDHVHPHKFRRTLATELARRGMPIQEVARILGHDKIDTTMRYVVLNDANVKHDYQLYA